MAGKKEKSGRIRCKGIGRKPKEFKRRAFSVLMKKTVLEYWSSNRTINDVLKKFWPELLNNSKEWQSRRKLIYQWRDYSLKIANIIESKSDQLKIRPSGTACSLSQQVENQIARWIRHLRSEGIPVSNAMTRMKSIEIAEENGLASDCFKASYEWLDGFKKRQHFSLRTKSNQGQRKPEDFIRLSEVFKNEIISKMKELGVSKIWNADQTAIFYELLPKRTISEKGTKTVWIRCAGKDKERVSVMLLGASDGTKKKPFVVFKQVDPNTEQAKNKNSTLRNGFGPKIWNSIEKTSKDLGIKIFANTNGWFTSSIVCEWLLYNFPFNTEPVLLLLDDFSGHWTNEVLVTAKKLNITIMKIPPGLTSVCQPADISWNKPFKNEMRNNWIKKLFNDMKVMKENFRALAPLRSEVLNWIGSAWEKLKESTIANGFSKPGFIESFIRIHEETPDNEDALCPESKTVIEYMEKNGLIEKIDDDNSFEPDIYDID